MNTASYYQTNQCIKAHYDSKEQYLFLDLTSWHASTVRLGNYCRGCSVERFDEHTGQWIEERNDPGLPVIGFTANYQFTNALYEYFQTYPKEWLDISSKFSCRQIIILRTLNEYPLFSELIGSNPVLAWFAVEYIAEEELDRSSVVNLLSGKREHILDVCMMHTREISVHLLSKICVKEFKHRNLRDLQKYLTDSALVNLIRHHRCMPLNWIPRLKRYSWMLRCRPFINNSEPGWRCDYCSMACPGKINYWALLDTVSLGTSIGIKHPKAIVLRCKSENELLQLYDRWSKLSDTISKTKQVVMFTEQYGTADFPSPPIAGNDFITPITTYNELIHEGKLMKHCVGTYGNRIMEGRSYIYKYEGEERATIQLVLCDETKSIKLNEVRLSTNRKPSEKTLQSIYDWCGCFVKQKMNIK